MNQTTNVQKFATDKEAREHLKLQLASTWHNSQNPPSRLTSG